MSNQPPTNRARGATRCSGRGPVPFVLEHDRRSLDVLLLALARPFGNNLT
jgi:hypothetical protein